MNTAFHKARFIFCMLCFLVAYAIILVHVFMIQIMQHDFFVQLGAQQYHVTLTRWPARGLIYDRHGNHVALNKDRFAAFTIPAKVQEPERLAAFLKKHFPKAYARLQEHGAAHFMYIKRRLTPEQYDLCTQSGLADLHILQEPDRFYPVGSAGILTGITDSDNKGLFGIELLYNDALAGKPSTVTLAKDARSGCYYFAQEKKIEGLEGKHVQLTLDADLQFLVHEELKKTVQHFGAAHAAALVVDPQTGECLACAQYPTFDPQDRHALEVPTTHNTLFTHAYELGSVMKAFVALALLQEKLVDLDEIIDCEQKKTTTIQGVTFSTTRSHGELTFTDVVRKSNNIGMVKAALRLGPLLYDHYVRMGFGKKTAVEWPAQQTGFVNPPANWSRSSPIALSFGYEIRATLAQLARAFCLIARDGTSVELSLVSGTSNHTSVQLYSPDVVQQLKHILERPPLYGATVYGKTGTARMVMEGKYVPDHNRYTFGGIVQKGSYQRVIVTFVEDIPHAHDLLASAVALPLFEAIAYQLLLHDHMMN